MFGSKPGVIIEEEKCGGKEKIIEAIKQQREHIQTAGSGAPQQPQEAIA